MRRRLLIAALGSWPTARVLADDEAAAPHQKISASELRRALAAQFPRRAVLANLFDVQVDADRLQLLAARQRVGATLLAKVRDLSSSSAYAAGIDVTFALRYEPADRTLRAREIEIAALHSPEFSPEAGRQWQALASAVARDWMDEVILHRFSRDELALPDSLGVQPRKISVENDGVVIWFGPRTPG